LVCQERILLANIGRKKPIFYGAALLFRQDDVLTAEPEEIYRPIILFQEDIILQDIK
jgi:hypothetical protein